MLRLQQGNSNNKDTCKQKEIFEIPEPHNEKRVSRDFHNENTFWESRENCVYPINCSAGWKMIKW